MAYLKALPKAPLLFILVCELVLRPLLLRWQTEGKGWFFCEYWLASLGYADDILVFSENKDDVVKMLGELVDAFAQVGLDISADKCALSSYPPQKQGILTVGGFELKWVTVTTEKPFSTGSHELLKVLGLGHKSYDHRELH